MNNTLPWDHADHRMDDSPSGSVWPETTAKRLIFPGQTVGVFQISPNTHGRQWEPGRQIYPTRDQLLHGAGPFYNGRMHLTIIIVIGWLYVAILAAATQPSIFIGILTFLFTGALPCGLILYFAGSKIRRQRQQFKEMMAERAKKDPGG